MGQAPPGAECNHEGRGVPFVKAGEFGDERPIIREWTTKPLKRGRRGDVFVCVVGATAGKINLGEDCAIGRSVAAIRPSCALDQHFLHRFMSTQVLRLRGGSTGSAQGVISQEALSNIALPLPSLGEQHRIVAKIDVVSARSKRARADLDRVEALVARAKVAIIHAAFASVRRLAKDMTVGETARVGTGATPKSGDPKYYEGGVVPWVTSGALNSENVAQGSAFVTEAALSETNCKLFPPDTVLLAMYGEGKTRGKSAILSITACTNQAIAAIQCDKEVVRSRYLFRFLQGRYEETRYAAAGGVQPNLNLSVVKAISLPVPSLDIQDQIVERIDVALAAVSRLTSQSTAVLKLLDRLDRSILDKAFRGELVPQDPADEPSSVQLNRIRAERAKPDPPKRHGRGARKAG
jgi:type I restriction enzyme S subunit